MKDILEKVKELFDWNKKELIIPEHIALTMDGIEQWGKKNEKSVQEAYNEAFFNLYKIIREQFKLEIQTFSVLIKSEKDNKSFEQALIKFLKELEKDPIVEENQLKISVLGKWYELNHEIVEPIKNLMNKTLQFEKFCLNLCINYDGKEEILNACKLIARKIKADKLDPLMIDENIFKENLYSSDINPVQLLIRNNENKKRGSFLLWHSVDAKLYLNEKLWPDLNENDILKAIVMYNKELENG